VHDDVAAVGDADRLVEILLGHQHRQALPLLQLLDLGDGVRYEDRREPHRGLVHDEQPGRRHERARDGEHLLLAARERAGQLAAALLQQGERLVAERGVPAYCRPGERPERPEEQVLLDRQSGEQPASLRHQRHAQVDDLLRGQTGEIVPLAVDLEHDRALRRAHHAHDAFQERALAVAVGAQQGDGFALRHGYRYPVQRSDGSIAGINVFDAKIQAHNEGVARGSFLVSRPFEGRSKA
jgi:hypothetical protein